MRLSAQPAAAAATAADHVTEKFVFTLQSFFPQIKLNQGSLPQKTYQFKQLWKVNYYGKK